jgi:hypothetical protein
MGRTIVNVALLAAVVALLCTGPAWAYLDPGTGSMMLQLLLGGIAGAMVVAKLYWHRFREFVTSRFSGNRSGRVEAKHGRAPSGRDAPDH